MLRSLPPAKAKAAPIAFASWPMAVCIAPPICPSSAAASKDSSISRIVSAPRYISRSCSVGRAGTSIPIAESEGRLPVLIDAGVLAAPLSFPAKRVCSARSSTGSCNCAVSAGCFIRYVRPSLYLRPFHCLSMQCRQTAGRAAQLSADRFRPLPPPARRTIKPTCQFHPINKRGAGKRTPLAISRFWELSAGRITWASSHFAYGM